MTAEIIAFHGVPLREQEPPPAWRVELIYSDGDKLKPRSMQNFIVTLRGEPALCGLFGYDEFASEIFLARRPPWFTNGGKWQPRSLTDNDIVRTMAELEKHGLSPKKNETADAIAVVAQDNKIHPVRHYLDGLAWDGIPRIQEALWEGVSFMSAASVYFGAADTPYAQEVVKRWLISAVARAYRPGCKADCALVLEGPQGKLKSTALKILGGEFFTDDLADFGSKDAAMQLQGRWIIEFPELDAMRKGDVEKVKAFLSRTNDRFRPPYGHQVRDFLRSSVLAGTTNSDRYLKDATGNRRFWPLKCEQINCSLLEQDRDQIWAEAVVMFRAREPWWLTGDMIAAAAEEQDSRVEEDTWTEVIDTHLKTAMVDRITTYDILKDALKIDPGKQTTTDAMRVGRVMKTIPAWDRQQLRLRPDGKRAWVYVRSTVTTSDEKR